MKDLSTLINSYKPIAKTGEDVVIDEFAKAIINKVFDQLSKIFPAWQYNWKTQKEIDGAKMEWTKAFNENKICTMEQIKYGFTKARSAQSDFLPSCGKFISWCEPSAEDLGFPSEYQAMQDCIKYRNNKKMITPLNINTRPVIVELCKRVNWFMINQASTQKERSRADKHFNDEYLSLISSGYKEPTETPHERLETTEVVSERMSDQQLEDRKQRGLSAMSDVRAKIRANKLNKLNNKDN